MWRKLAGHRNEFAWYYEVDKHGIQIVRTIDMKNILTDLQYEKHREEGGKRYLIESVYIDEEMIYDPYPTPTEETLDLLGDVGVHPDSPLNRKAIYQTYIGGYIETYGASETTQSDNYWDGLNREFGIPQSVGSSKKSSVFKIFSEGDGVEREEFVDVEENPIFSGSLDREVVADEYEEFWRFGKDENVRVKRAVRKDIKSQGANWGIEMREK